MDQARLLRKNCKSWVTRQSNYLLGALERNAGKHEIKEQIEEFVKKVDSLEEAQTALELLIDDDEDREEMMQEAADYNNTQLLVKVKALERLETLSTGSSKTPSIHPDDSASQVASHKSVAKTHNSAVSENSYNSVSPKHKSSKKIKLPKLSLPMFNGNIYEWSEFIEAFEMHIGNDEDLEPVEKLSHLRSLLEGDAARVAKAYRLVGSNYKPTLDHLKRRFGRPSFIRLQHINALNALESVAQGSGPAFVKDLYLLLDNITVHVNALHTLGLDGSKVEAFLCPAIIGRFPKSLRDEWAKNSKGKEGDLAHTMDFLHTEVERLELSSTYDAPTYKTAPQKISQEKRSKGSATALISSTETVSKEAEVCGICSKKGHRSHKCLKLKRAHVDVRIRLVKDAGICFKCLKGHRANTCNVTCMYCEGPHNGLLCFKHNAQRGSNPLATYIKNLQPQAPSFHPSQVNPTHPEVVPQAVGVLAQNQGVSYPQLGISTDMATVSISTGLQNSEASLASLRPSNYGSILQTAQVKVKTLSGEYKSAVMLLDTGADRSYVSSELVCACQPMKLGKELISYASFGGEHTSKSEMRSMLNLEISDLKGNSHFLQAAEIPSICAPLNRTQIPATVLERFKGLKFADNYGSNNHFKVDILVGLNAYWRFVDPTKAIQHEGLVAQQTVFGYLLSGSWGLMPQSVNTSTQLCCVSQQALTQFWSLEQIGIMDKEDRHALLERDPVLQQFRKNLEYFRELPRYQVAIPFKSVNHKKFLHSNLGVALKRLHWLNKRLDKQEMRNPYYEVIMDYFYNDMWEFVPRDEIHTSGPIYYLPHFPVVRQGASSTKIRPVFDASAKKL